MACSEDYRRRTVEYYQEGNSQTKVKEIFKVYPKTLREWEARMEDGNLKPIYPKTRMPRKLPPDELAAYVEQNPDAFLTETSARFNCSDAAVYNPLRKKSYAHNSKYHWIYALFSYNQKLIVFDL